MIEQQTRTGAKTAAGETAAGERATGWRAEAPPRARFSLELFPPKSPQALAELRSELERLATLSPRFVSVTCGAGGGGGAATLETIRACADAIDAPFAAHIVAWGNSKGEIGAIARKAWNAGVRRVVALRGDPRPGQARDGRGYRHASDLILGLRASAPFEIAAACFPEGHPEAASLDDELDNLERKVEAGASRLIGQYCFDTDRILRFRDALARRGLEGVFTPGVMPVHDYDAIKRFSERCEASLPAWLDAVFAGIGAPERARLHRMVAAGLAAEQCRRLVAEGLADIHVYCLNRSELALAVHALMAAPQIETSRANAPAHPFL